MSLKITIAPGGHSCEAVPGSTILESALAAGLMLPYGCRNGACGSCKGKLVAGEIDYGNYQESALPETDKAAGLALFCCAMPRSDITIECREVRAIGDIPVRILPCRVQRMERLAPDVIALHLKLPANERLQFLAGQYIEFLLKGGRRRAFSVANAPHDDELLQVHVRLVPGGHFTEHVFAAMKERDILRFDGPHGSFFLREGDATPLIFIAGGTGFAPIKAMIEHALHQDSQRPMVLYWGARQREGLYLNELAVAWAAKHSNITYVPVLSDPLAGDAWDGRTGLVHHAVMADHPDLAAYTVYACGAPAMIDAARDDLTARCHLAPEAFFADSFTFASDPVAAP